jgi:5-methylcytosine-specific restriction protein A
MPMAPPRACATCGQPGCQQHRRPAWGHAQPVARVRGRRLQRLRHQLFRGQPFCARCHVEVATVRDHVVPLAEGGLDAESNVQALCQTCSDAKTAAESKRGIQRGGPR